MFSDLAKTLNAIYKNLFLVLGVICAELIIFTIIPQKYTLGKAFRFITNDLQVSGMYLDMALQAISALIFLIIAFILYKRAIISNDADFKTILKKNWGKLIFSISLVYLIFYSVLKFVYILINSFIYQNIYGRTGLYITSVINIAIALFIAFVVAYVAYAAICNNSFKNMVKQFFGFFASINFVYVLVAVIIISIIYLPISIMETNIIIEQSKNMSNFLLAKDTWLPEWFVRTKLLIKCVLDSFLFVYAAVVFKNMESN